MTTKDVAGKRRSVHDGNYLGLTERVAAPNLAGTKQVIATKKMEKKIALTRWLFLGPAVGIGFAAFGLLFRPLVGPGLLALSLVALVGLFILMPGFQVLLLSTAKYKGRYRESAAVAFSLTVAALATAVGFGLFSFW